MTFRYQLNVNNLGQVFCTNDAKAAKQKYDAYVALSKLPNGRVSSEAVTLLEDGEVLLDYDPESPPKPVCAPDPIWRNDVIMTLDWPTPNRVRVSAWCVSGGDCIGDDPKRLVADVCTTPQGWRFVSVRGDFTNQVDIDKTSGDLADMLHEIRRALSTRR